MLYFANPGYLYLLILAAAFLPAFALLRKLRSERIRQFADEKSAKELMPSSSGAKAWVRAVLFTIAFIFFVFGLARPQTGAKLTEHKSNGVEVMICLDVSNSMLAEDYSPNRLERAKLAISRFVDKLNGDRIGLIIFAGQSFVQLPITTDYVSAKMFLSSIEPGSVPVQGTDIADAIRTAVRSFSTQSTQSRAIIVISDGENHESSAVEAAQAAAETGVRIFTVGVGTPQGKPIPYHGGLLKDREGNTVVTKLDEEALMEIAKVGNGAYVRAGDLEFGLNPIIDNIRSLQEEEFSSMVFEEYDEQYMYCFAVALLLLVVEMLIGQRKLKVNLFKDEKN